MIIVTLHCCISLLGYLFLCWLLLQQCIIHTLSKDILLFSCSNLEVFFPRATSAQLAAFWNWWSLPRKLSPYQTFIADIIRAREGNAMNTMHDEMQWWHSLFFDFDKHIFSVNKHHGSWCDLCCWALYSKDKDGKRTDDIFHLCQNTVVSFLGFNRPQCI